jgi:serine/threonine protein kinase
MLQENTLFADRYQLLQLLGRGGFSEVWLAKDSWTHLQVAVKVYAPGQGMDQDGLKEFCGELAAVYDLNHSNLLKPQHVDKWQNMPYLIMAYCSKGSCVKRVGKMSEKDIWKLLHDVGAGLAYLHDKDLIHQDIKPDNILIDNEGNFLITDFGISSRARNTLQKSVVAASASKDSGTVAYMGPERFTRQPAPIKASDIWSLGATVYELVEGNTPFPPMVGGGMQKSGAEIPFINKPVSDTLKYVIFKMLSKETWDRPTAAQLVAWANNPKQIKVDYSLLSDDEPTPQPSDRGGQATTRINALTLSVSPKTWTAPAAGGSVTVNVDTNGNCTQPTSTQSWVSITRKTDKSFTIKCEPNKTGKQRTYTVRVSAKNMVETKTAEVAIVQPALPKKSKAWLWVMLICVVASIIGVSIHNKNEEKERVRNGHYSAVSQFDNYLASADMDNIQDFENAKSYLSTINEYENHEYFVGGTVYSIKKAKLKNKLQEVYTELDAKYRKAPDGTNLKKNLKSKRDQIATIKNSL